MSETLLVPYDFSPDAEVALQYAITLGVALQGEILLVHVRDNAEWNPWVYSGAATVALREALQGCLQPVHDAGLKGEVLLLHGVPWQEIVQSVQPHHATLIVMGTHGRTGFRRLLLGSVAEKVVRHAPCAVLVTRHPDALPVLQEHTKPCAS